MALNETDDVGQASRARARDRGVLRGVIATVVVQGVTSGASLVTIAITAGALSAAELGLVLTLVQLWLLILLVSDLGIGVVLTTRIAAAHGRDDVTEMRSQGEIALAVLTCIAVLVVAGGSVAAFVLPWESWIGGGALPASVVTPAVLVSFVAAGLTLPSVVGTAVLTGLQRQARAQSRFAVCSIAGVLGCVLAGWAGAGPWGFVLAFLGPQVAVGLVYTWLVLWVEYPHLRPRRVRLALHEFRGFLAPSASMAALRISDAVINGTGMVVISVLEGPVSAAVYGVASRICLVVGSVLQTAGAQVWPAMTEAIACGDVGWARSRYRRSVVLVAGASLLGGLGVCLTGPSIARLLGGGGVQPPFLLFFALTVVTIMSALNVQMAVVVGASQIYRPIALAFVRGAPVAIALSVLLTSAVGVEGPAIAAALAYGAVVSPRLYVLTRRTLRGLESRAG